MLSNVLNNFLGSTTIEPLYVYDKINKLNENIMIDIKFLYDNHYHYLLYSMSRH